VWSLVIAHIALKVVRFSVLIISAPRIQNGKISGAYAKEISRLAFGFSLARLLNLLSLQGDNFVVGRLIGTEALGIYNRAYQLMTLPAMYIGQVYERVMFPALAREQDDIKRVRESFLVALEVVTLTALPAGVAIYTLSGEIVLGGFGERWVEVAPILSILSFGVFFRTAYKCSDTTVRALGAVYHYAARQALYAVLVIGGAFLGAKIGGLAGVAYGVVIAVGINYLSMTRLCIKLSGVSLIKVFRAHISGVWVSAWSWLVLERGVDYIRLSVGSDGAGDALLVLFYGGVLALVVWVVSVLAISCFIQFGVLPVLRGYLFSRKASALG
jgi:O-antigen/teichoic acid export membrane protein